MPPAGEHADQSEPWTDLPSPAAALTEVTHRQARELVPARVASHLFQQFLGFALALNALIDPRMQLLQATGEPVSQPLEVLKVE
jgi:hypothetical protein